MSKTISSRVVSRRLVADDIVELEFVGDREPLPVWEPGAHADVHLPNGLIRQYSLMPGVTDPRAWRVAVLTEHEGRGGSRYLTEKVAEGQYLSLGEPRNHFPLDPAERYVFIGGGIGVTPLIAMIEQAQAQGVPWTLHYLGRTRAHLAYAAELAQTYGERVSLHIADEGTRLVLSDVIGRDRANAAVYACGPERLLDALEDLLGESDLLHIERFAPKEQEFLPNRRFTVVAERSGVEFEVAEDESIFMAADFEGIDVEGDCLEGTCGSCETRVIDGDIEHRDSILTPRQRREGDCMMICVSRALRERIVLDL